MIQSARMHTRSALIFWRSLADEWVRITRTFVHIISIGCVVAICYAEIYRRSFYGFDSEELNWICILIVAGYCGVCVRSIRYNLILIFSTLGALKLAMKYGFFIEPKELGRHIKTWNNLVGIYVIVGGLCTIVYLLRTMIQWANEQDAKASRRARGNRQTGD